MSSIYQFFGTILGVFYGTSKSLVASCAVICLLLKFMFAPMTNSYYRIPKISEQLQPQLDEIDKKYGKNKEKRTKAISDLLVRND